MKKTLIRLLIGVVILALALAACETGEEKTTEEKQRDAVASENAAAATGFQRLLRSQQIPVFDFSQERQTLIDVLTMRAEGTHGTAYATTIDGTMLWWCPSLGAPIPSTYQLTPGDQYVDIKGDGTKEKFPIDQGEQTGVYVGDSAATWTVCLDDNGTAFAKYEEANVGWTGGVVDGLPGDLRAHIDEITYEFSTAEPEE